MAALSHYIKNRVNLYLTLDILPGSSHSEILHAYNRAKSTYSGNSVASYTLVDGEQSISIMEEIEEAYQILGNPARRREYDLAMGYDTWSEDGVSRDDLRPVGPSIISKEGEVSGDMPPELTHSMVRTPLAVEPASKKSFESKSTFASRMHPTARPMAEVVHLAPATHGQFEPNPEFEQKISETIEVDGAFLRAVRMYRKMSPDQLAMLCKLSATHVHAIEEEDSSRLPHAVYLRGHVFMMAQVLGLPDPDQSAKTFVNRMRHQKKLPRTDLKG